MLRIAVPNKGTLSAPGRRHAARGRLPAALRRPGPGLPRRRSTTSSSSTCGRATSPPTSAPATSTSASPDGTCWSTPAAGAEEVLDLDFGGATFRFAARAGRARRRGARRPGRPPHRDRVPGRGRAPPRPTTASSADRGPPRRRGRERDPARRRRRHRRRGRHRRRRCARPAWRRSASRSSSRSALLDPPPGAEPAAAGDPAGAPAAGRAGGPALRDARLRRAAPTGWTTAVALTPGIESPTVSPLHREGWVAVQAMVLRDDVHRIMDELYDVGARAILVTDIHACRL